MKMKVRKKQIFLVSLLLLELTAVLLFAKMMWPIRDGTSAEFWLKACGVNLDGVEEKTLGGIYLPRDGWYIYYIQGYHEQFLYRVPRSVAVADYLEVFQRIENATNEVDAALKRYPAYLVIEQNRSQVEKNPEMFLSLIRDEIIMKLKSKDEKRYQYHISQEKAFSERWVRAQLFWRNIFFEIIFFGCLTLFAFWPWLQNRGWRKTSLHLGLLPFLLFLPYYFGYASWTFTSVGPSGGALYPWVIVWFRGFPIWTHLDQWLLNTLPNVFESFSQPLGPMLSISGGRPLGPIAALLIGLLVFGLTQVTYIYLRSKNFAMKASIGNVSQTPDGKILQQDAEDDAINRVP